MCAKTVKKISKNPKSLYFEAKRNKERSPDEKTIARPYNYKLKKFVSNKDEYSADMFLYSIAYLRHVLKRNPEIHKKEYRKVLEEQLLKYFHPYSAYSYACLLGSKLPSQLHQRMTLESFVDNDRWITEYFENFGKKHPRKGKSGILSKTDETYNYLLANPLAEHEEIIAELWKKGLRVTKSMITKTMKQMAEE